MTSILDTLQSFLDALKKVDDFSDAGVLPYAGTKYQEFELFVRNDNGTLKHKIIALNNLNPIVGGVASAHADLVNGASPSYTVTPVGNDTTVDFAAGVKISSANPHMLFLDVPEQVEGASSALVDVISSNGGVAVLVSGDFTTININGVTRNRLMLPLTNPLTAAGISWASHLNSHGKFVRTRVVGYLKSGVG